jgi:hypothetical protein
LQTGFRLLIFSLAFAGGHYEAAGQVRTPSSTAAAPAPAAPAPAVRTALYFQLGQSNAVGLAPLGQLPASVDFSTGARPIQEVQLFSGAGELATYRLRNLRYLRTVSDTAIDSIDGPITGQRGETVIDYDTSSSDRAMSSFIGVAEQIAGGYNKAASRVILMKVARGGTFITGQDPEAVSIAGGVYKNGRRAYIKWLRGFIDTEAKAGRVVDMQMAEFSQGEREAALARVTSELPSARMVAWPDTLRANIYPYYAEKFGVSFPLLIRQLLPIRTSNDPAAPLDPFTVAQNNIEQGICRYTVTINPDGSIKAVVDNGASPLRINTAYFLKHDMVDASLVDVHAGYRLSKVFGIAKVNLQKYLEPGDQGLTSFKITRIAPVIMDYQPGTPTATTIPVEFFVDEAAKIYVLAVRAGAPAPTIAMIKLNGQINTSTVDVNGNGWPQTFAATRLTMGTAYDVYAVAADPIYGHMGSVFKVAANVTTARQ